MIIADNITLLKSSLANLQTGKRVLVPTMGNLHEGHLSLIRQAKTYSSQVIVSIFVNPLQFGPSEDFNTYPRTLEKDLTLLRELGVSLVFTPSISEVYPDLADQCQVQAPQIAADLCGIYRPIFFHGVVTVVAKLFNLIQPDIAIFGEKDFQQLHIIRKMVKDLCFPVEIVAGPTVRESDGLAMSSRNQYLTEKERQHAKAIYSALITMKSRLAAGEKKYQQLIVDADKELTNNFFKMDYIQIRNQDTLEPATLEDKTVVILMAGWLGRTRLIDNMTVVLEY
jgi:pantoate--beta-alanine ligase